MFRKNCRRGWLSQTALLCFLLSAAFAMPAWCYAEAPDAGFRIEPTAVAVETPVDLSSLRSRQGTSFVIRNVTGTTTGSVWGTTVYTDDSDLGTAAVHAGRLKPGETADVQVTLLPGRVSYEASTSNDVASRPYPSWSGSFVFDTAPTLPESVPPISDETLPPQRELGQQFDLNVVGSADGSVWGTTVYTDDSHLGTAAVHAGVLQVGQRGQVRVTILPGRDRYHSANRNGVTSSSYGSWSGSYFIEAATPYAAEPASGIRLQSNPLVEDVF